MKIRSLLALAGLAISFAVPTFAQQKDTVDPRIAQQRDLLADQHELDGQRGDQGESRDVVQESEQGGHGHGG